MIYTPLTKKAMKLCFEAHKDQPGPTIVMLHDVQNELGYVPFEAMEKIAEACGTSVAEVYGVVMFYAQFTTEPKGKHVINVCLGTACYVKGAACSHLMRLDAWVPAVWLPLRLLTARLSVPPQKATSF